MYNFWGEHEKTAVLVKCMWILLSKSLSQIGGRFAVFAVSKILLTDHFGSSQSNLFITNPRVNENKFFMSGIRHSAVP